MYLMALAMVVVLAGAACLIDITAFMKLVDLRTELDGKKYTIQADFEMDPSAPTTFYDVFFRVDVLEGSGCPCTVLNSDPPNGGVGSHVNGPSELSPGDTFTQTFEL